MSSSSGSRLILECHIEQGGLINQAHSTELMLRYLKGYENMKSYFQN